MVFKVQSWFVALIEHVYILIWECWHWMKYVFFWHIGVPIAYLYHLDFLHKFLDIRFRSLTAGKYLYIYFGSVAIEWTNYPWNISCKWRYIYDTDAYKGAVDREPTNGQTHPEWLTYIEYIHVWTDKSMQQSKTIQRQHSLTSRTRQYDIDWTMWKAYHANGGYLFDFIII